MKTGRPSRDAQRTKLGALEKARPLLQHNWPDLTIGQAIQHAGDMLRAPRAMDMIREELALLVGREQSVMVWEQGQSLDQVLALLDRAIEKSRQRKPPSQIRLKRSRARKAA